MSFCGKNLNDIYVPFVFHTNAVNQRQFAEAGDVTAELSEVPLRVEGSFECGACSTRRASPFALRNGPDKRDRWQWG